MSEGLLAMCKKTWYAELNNMEEVNEQIAQTDKPTPEVKKKVSKNLIYGGIIGVLVVLFLLSFILLRSMNKSSEQVLSSTTLTSNRAKTTPTTTGSNSSDSQLNSDASNIEIQLNKLNSDQSMSSLDLNSSSKDIPQQ